MSPRRVITWIALVTCVMSAPAVACSIVVSSRPSAYHYDDKVYVFYGEVIGYTSLRTKYCDNDPSGKDCRSWGLLLKVLHPLQLPRATSTIGVFGFGMSSMCGLETVSESEVRIRTAVGTRLAV